MEVVANNKLAVFSSVITPKYVEMKKSRWQQI